MSFIGLTTVQSDRIMLSLFGAVRTDSLRDSVAMNPQRVRGVRDALVISREGFLDVKLLELFQSFIEKDVAIEHVLDEGF